jgi:hypothetical protein
VSSLYIRGKPIVPRAINKYYVVEYRQYRELRAMLANFISYLSVERFAKKKKSRISK